MEAPGQLSSGVEINGDPGVSLPGNNGNEVFPELPEPTRLRIPDSAQPPGESSREIPEKTMQAMDYLWRMLPEDRKFDSLIYIMLCYAARTSRSENEAARRLGMNSQTVRSWMAKYKIELSEIIRKL